MSTLVAPPGPSRPSRGAQAPLPAGSPVRPWSRERRRLDALLALALGALVAAVSLAAGGGLQLGRLDVVQVVLIVVGGVLGALALLLTRRQPLNGLGFVLGFGAIALVTALSITWAVQPDDAWIETNRTLTYLMALVAAVALVRLLPGRWSAIVGATIVASVIVSGYALLTKVFPGTFAPGATYARLREPFGYWNAVGIMAVLGMPGTLWLGARRAGHAAASALAYPVMGLLVLTTLLTYSRGSLLAAAIALVVWFVAVPLRLRSAAVLAAGAAAALLVALWAFGQDALTIDFVTINLRTYTGHQLGVLVLVMLLVLAGVGLGVGFATSNRAPGLATRRQAGTALLVLLALVPIVAVVALALSSKGLGGSISSGWTQLTDPNASTPANTPDRLTAVGSVRARYYDESLKLYDADKLHGVGAGGYATARTRVRNNDLDVLHSHGYLFQTLADMGLLGAGASLLALIGFWWAAARTFGWRRRRDREPPAATPERVATLALLCVVVAYGVHSFVDWTWFIPGPTVLALLAAGWIAGRGPLPADRAAAAIPPTPLPRLAEALRARPAAIGAGLAVVLSVLVAWTVVQPERAASTGDDALEQLSAGRIEQARATAERAHDIDPLSVEPLYDLAVVETRANRLPAARVALQRAVEIQPRNPEPWLRLADFELTTQRDAPSALSALGPALYLDPRSSQAVTLYLQASRRTSP